jgi:hypothetical protein
MMMIRCVIGDDDMIFVNEIIGTDDVANGTMTCVARGVTSCRDRMRVSM